MENIAHLPHSFSNKSNTHTGKSIYDDVFGGAPKFGFTSLAPRLEDYAEIFGGFHASRGRSSSIPVLDLPPVDEVDLTVVSTSDYSQVFGGFNGLEFAASFEDLVNEANGGYDSSNEAWSPAQSETLSDQTNPSALSERSQSFSDVDLHHSSDGIQQIEVLYHKAHQRSNGDISTGKTNFTCLQDIRGYTCVVDENAGPEILQDEKRSFMRTNDLNYRELLGGGLEEDKSCESVSLSMNSGLPLRSRPHFWETRSKSGPIPNQPCISVSDISLRTRPSHLPPPSRPPPAIAAQKEESRLTNPKHRTSLSYTVGGENSSPLFDLEADVYASAMQSAASMEDALCKTQGKHPSTEELVERRDKSLQSSMKLQVKDDLEHVAKDKNDQEDRIPMASDHGNGSTGDRLQGSQAKEGILLETFSDERERALKVRDNNLNGKSVKEEQKENIRSSEVPIKSEETVSWREAAEYYEVETDFFWKDYEQLEDKATCNSVMESYDDQWRIKAAKEQKKKTCDKTKTEKRAPECEETHDRLNVVQSLSKCVPGECIPGATTGSRCQKEDQENVWVSGGVGALDFDQEEVIVMHGDIGKLRSLETKDESQNNNVTKANRKPKAAAARTEKKKVYDAISRKGNELMPEEVFEINHRDKRNKAISKPDSRKMAEDRVEQEEREKHQESFNTGGNEMKKAGCERNEIKYGLKVAIEQMDDSDAIHRACSEPLVKLDHALDDHKEEGDTLLSSDRTHKLEDELAYTTQPVMKLERSETSPSEMNNNPETEVEVCEESPNVKGRCNLHNGVLQQEECKTRINVTDVSGDQDHPPNLNDVSTGYEKPLTSQIGILSHMAPDPEVLKKNTVGEGIMKKKLTKPQLVGEWVNNAKKISDGLWAVLEDIGGIADTPHREASQGTETKEKNMSGISLPEERKIENRLSNDKEHEHLGTMEEEMERRRERNKDLMDETRNAGERLIGRDVENEHLKRIEEEREREREREKDRMAVDNASREAREKSFVDPRERAERAALERATSEARQRAMAEARERLEKASVEAREARFKAERAAVERATAEARQRAFEKAMATKNNFEAKDRPERSADKPQSMEMKRSWSASDSCNTQFQSAASGLRYTYSSAHVGVEGESPQRCKARLERYQRTAERAAKALAEKNMRDLVAQREQEERNRLAETLDAEVRRWSSGKEGNLRALLSTLQYILGPDSGWHPIPLTEVITSAAVKRAYRKATLCVHPDKLQQRGANTHQKYICEKVFDLLKEAWNKFNSEER